MNEKERNCQNENESVNDFEFQKVSSKKTISFIMAVVMIIGMFSSAFPLSVLAEKVDEYVEQNTVQPEMVTTSCSGDADGDYRYNGFTYDIFNKEVIIRNSSVWGDVVIPEYIRGYPVVRIACSAFDGCYGMKSIDIPDTVRYIEHYAFEGCTKLKEISIPASVDHIEEGVFYDCSGLRSLSIYNPDCYIYGNITGNNQKVYIRGHQYSTAQSMANKYGKKFADFNAEVSYYEEIGNIAVVTNQPNGLSLMGCTVTIDGVSSVMTKSTEYFDIPDGYTGDVVVSKEGYISSRYPAEYLKKYNFFVMYPDTTEGPVVQHYLTRDAKQTANVFSDMLHYNEYVYDLEEKQNDFLISVNANGKTIRSIYFLQGDNRFNLVNGMNENFNTSGNFRSNGGEIYLCIDTTDGVTYKRPAKIKALSSRIKLDSEIGGSVSGQIPDDIDGLGGWEYKAGFDIGQVPISFTITDNKVKGAIGIKGDEKFTQTWYNDIKDVITTHEKNGKKTYTKKTMENLEKKIKSKGGDVYDGNTSFGIDVSGEIIGYIEATFNPVTYKLENIQSGLILKVSGKAQHTTQNCLMITVIPVPYYWTVAIELEVAAQIASNISYDKNNNVDFSAEMPSISIGLDVSGSLNLGVNGIIGGGGKIGGGINVTFKAPEFDFSTSEWVLSCRMGLTGQIAGFGGDFNFFDEDVQIYPWEKAASTASLSTLMTDYASSNKLLASTLPYSESVYNTYLSEIGGEGNIFKSGGYMYSEPKVAYRSDGTAVMVWIDYDEDRSDVNKTALFYSVYDPVTNVWSDPMQVDDDGTADDNPVLKTIGDDIYLVWNDADSELEDSATVMDMLACMGVSYSVFDGKEFSSAISVTEANGYMDIVPDITVDDNGVVIVWLKNEENDIFGQTGTNSIMMATLSESANAVTEVFNTTAPINSFKVIRESGNTVIYYSADGDGDINTFNDYEIYKIVNGEVTQVTSNDVSDTSVVSVSDSVFWSQGDTVKSAHHTVECEGVGSQYCVAESLTGFSVIYPVDKGEGVTAYMFTAKTEDGMSTPVELASGNFVCQDLSAYWDNNTLYFVTNEVSEDYSTADIKVYEFDTIGEFTIDGLYYDEYTLVSNGLLDISGTISNTGLYEIPGYCVEVYEGEELLTVYEEEDYLLPGQASDIKIYVELPETIDFSNLDFVLKYDAGSEVITADSKTMDLGLTDISLENAVINSNGENTVMSVSVANRGISDISSATVKLHKDSEDGEVIATADVFDIASRDDEIIEFDMTSFIEEGVTYYVTVDALENEFLTVNNVDFAAYYEYVPDKVVEETIYDKYDKIEVGKECKITIDADNAAKKLLFIPKEDGLYSFSSYNTDADVFGSVMDLEYNILAKNDDSGEGNNFNVEYSLTAGTAYLLNTSSYSVSDAISCTVKVEKIDSVSNVTGYCGDDLIWEFDDDGVLTIYGSGAMYYYSSSSTSSVPWYSIRSQIVTVLIKPGVTEISANSFYAYKNITSVSLSDTLEKIGSEAFFGCDKLTSISIPVSVENIGIDAFYNCKSLTGVYITDLGNWCNVNFNSIYSNPLVYAQKLYLNGELLTDVVLPDTIGVIKNNTFYGCTAIENVVIPDSVIEIGPSAFYGCISLTDIVIPDSVTTIGYSAFGDCMSLSSVTIPDSVTEIGNNAFDYCYSLTIRCMPCSYAESYALDKNFHIEHIISVSGIEIGSLPAKTVYPVNGELKIAGLELKVILADGSIRNLTKGYTLGSYDFSTAGEKVIDISYAGVTVSFKVTVDSTLVEYPESDHPYANSEDKTWTYTHPTECDALVITFSEDTYTESNYDFIYIYDASGYASGDAANSLIGKFTGDELSGVTLRINTNSFTIRLTSDSSINKFGFSIDNIQGISIENIALIALPVKTVYPINGQLITDGLELEITYTDGNTSTVTDGYTVGEYDFSTEGEKEITVSYLGYTFTFTVTVDPTLVEYPESAHPYPNNSSESWTYIHPFIFESLKVTFSSDTYFEAGWDYVVIYDLSGNEIGYYTGNELSGETITIYDVGFTIQLFSDGSYNYYGFSIDNIEGYSEECIHSFSNYVYNEDATCTEDGTMTAYCDYGCGESDTYIYEGSAKGHDWSDWYEVIAPTEESVGEEQRDCWACEAFEYREIPMLEPPVDENAPYVTVYNYDVFVDKSDEIKYIRYALGEYSTASEIKNAQGCVTLNATKIAEYSNYGECCITMPNGGVYSLWIKMNDGSEYIYKADLSVMYQEVVADGVTVTVKNLYGVKDYFIAKGEYDNYSDLRANALVQITKNKIGTKHDYTYILSTPGTYTVCVRYDDSTREHEFITFEVTVNEPTFTENGLQLIVGNLEGIKVIRTAYGEYNTPGKIKRAEGARAFTGKSVLKGLDEYAIQYRDEGIVTVAVVYNNGYEVMYTYDVTKKTPQMYQDGNTVTFDCLDDLKVIRYAKGEYATSNQIKNAKGSISVSGKTMEETSYSVTLTPGTYTFCVQYNDDSYNYYVITVE